MHADPDDDGLLHGHFARRIPAIYAATRVGRAFVRHRFTRMIERELHHHGYEPAQKMCVHFGVIDGRAAAVVHFVVRDTIAAAFAEDGAGQ